jgi:hypothetical protein
VKHARGHRLIILVHSWEFAGLKVDAGTAGLSVSDHVRRMLGLPAARAKDVQAGASVDGRSHQGKPGGSQGTPV